MKHEEEARKIVTKWVHPIDIGGPYFNALIADVGSALRKRDEKRDDLYDAAWAECEAWRSGDVYSDQHASGCIVYRGDEAAMKAHDTIRREAGKEKA